MNIAGVGDVLIFAGQQTIQESFSLHSKASITLFVATSCELDIREIVNVRVIRCILLFHLHTFDYLEATKSSID